MHKYNNNLLNEYHNKNAKNNNITANNQFLADSALFKTPGAISKIQLAKIEKIKRAKNISDLGLNKNQLINYVICPITVTRMNKNELEQVWHKSVSDFKPQRDEWQKARTNMPYKNILKKENYNREFKTKEDLIVHKVTNADKLELMENYEKLLNIIKKHNDQLEIIFSNSEKHKHLKKFEYVQKYKYKHDPKSNVDDLKLIYKKEQDKIIKGKKKYDEIVDALVQNKILDDNDIKLLNEEEINNDSDDSDDNIDNINNYKVDDINDDKVDNINDDKIDNINDDKVDDINNNTVNNINDNKVDNRNDDKANDKNIKKSRIKVKTEILNTVKSEDVTENKINLLKDKYKNRKMR